MAGHEQITGTGLGLPIARDLARRMEGDLDVASVPDAGSAFVLVLPGPAVVEPDVIAAALGRALAAEEEVLQDRLIRRTLASGLPRALPPADDETGLSPRRADNGRLRVLPTLREETPTPV
jgi:hypothetical protein